MKRTMGTLLLLGSLVSGCGASVRGRVTGGGWFPSAAEDGTKANFGFNASSCDATFQCGVWSNVKGHFNFHDKGAGVKLNGEVVGVTKCLWSGVYNDSCRRCFEPGGEGDYVIAVDYRSTNPFAPGTGEAFVCVRDNGEGLKATRSDFVKLVVDSGPFEHYSNSGTVQGNIQAHACD
jgi:hypothetical protein